MKRVSAIIAFLMAAVLCAGLCPGARAAEALTWRDCLRPQQLISAGDWHTVAILSGGTVAAAGLNDRGQCDVGGWTDIIAVSAGSRKTLGLRGDGSVLIAGNDDYGQGEAGGWREIVAVSAGGSHTVGLKADGTVLACGKNEFGECDVGDWKNIVAISAGDQYTLGLRADGTVAAAGLDEYLRGKGRMEVGAWTGIRAIAAGGAYSVGLREDGTALLAGTTDLEEPRGAWMELVKGWKGLAAVASASSHVLGLGLDGMVIGAPAGWDHLVAVSRNYSGNHSIGLKQDGTLIAVGDNRYGQCDISAWQGLMTVPRSPGFLPDTAPAVPDAGQTGSGLAADMTYQALEGTWTGVYRFTGATNLEQADVAQDARERFQAILGRDKFFQLAFTANGVEITAESLQGDTGPIGGLPPFTLQDGAFSAAMPYGDGNILLTGSVYRTGAVMEIRGNYQMSGPMPGNVTVTFLTDFAVIQD